jgi:hypothetical protein
MTRSRESKHAGHQGRAKDVKKETWTGVENESNKKKAHGPKAGKWEVSKIAGP